MQVGAFELEEQIGAGGMGVIWGGRHVGLGVAAAVKFDLHPPDEAWRAAFVAEVRRIAELDHPNVVHIFDTGLVTAAEASQSNGNLVVGMPWLAMELARGGAVADEGNLPRTWPEVLHVMRSLLLALAQSHAAGIVHRDIKPGNLLLAGARSSLASTPNTLLGSRVVLSDFGIGHDRDRPGWMDEQSVGTPRYMAPEQIEANWRNQGPWTDLYQAGVLLWRFVTGDFPFRQQRSIQLYRAHLFSPLPRFEPCMEVPDGIEAICRGLLEKQHTARPQFAADVIAQLDALGDPVSGSATGASADPEQAPTEIAGATTVNQTASRLTPESAAVLDMNLRGAGLGLWGLRPLPLVGRQETRETLWQALTTVRKEGRARLAILRGPAGVGKTRMARWLAHRGHERGAALPWMARHSELVDADHGLPGMFRKELQLEGLERGDAADRIRAMLALDRSGEVLVTWLLGPARPEDRMPTTAERLGLLWRVLEHLSFERPLILVLDDAHFGAGALQLVQSVLDQPEPLPVLFVVTVCDELLAERPDEGTRIRALEQNDRCTMIALEPLNVDQHRELVRKMLGLEGKLAVEVEQRTAGNPAFAVQLVNSWVASGLLVAGPKGFRLEGGLPPDLPSDLLEVWRGRIERLVATLSTEDLRALELLAVLGVDVQTRRWRAACRIAEVRLRPGLLGNLLRSHLLRADARLEHIQFAHNGVREALLARIREVGRWAWANDRCATLLLHTAGDPERLAGHLIASDRLGEAVQPLLDSIESTLSQGDMRSPKLLETLTRVLKGIPAPKDDDRWGHLWLNWAWYHRLQGNRDEADRQAARAERTAEKRGWTAVHGWALREAGNTAMDQAEYEEALGFLARAETVLEASGRHESAAFCRSKMADAFELLGRYDEAEKALRSILEVFDEEPRAWVYAASPNLALAQLLQKRGRLMEALHFAEEARWRAERVGQHAKLAHIAMVEGEVARYRGDLEAAEAFYTESVERYQAFHDPTAVVPTLNLGVVQVMREQFTEARALMESLLATLEAARGRKVFVAYARSVLMACTAALGDEKAFDEHYLALEAFIEKSGLADPDILKLAGIAEQRATGRRMRARARAMRVGQEKRLGS